MRSTVSSKKRVSSNQPKKCKSVMQLRAHNVLRRKPLAVAVLLLLLAASAVLLLQFSTLQDRLPGSWGSWWQEIGPLTSLSTLLHIEAEESAWLLLNTCFSLLLPFVELLSHLCGALRLQQRSAKGKKLRSRTASLTLTEPSEFSLDTGDLERSDSSITTPAAAAAAHVSSDDRKPRSSKLATLWRSFVPPMSTSAALCLAAFLVWNTVTFVLPLVHRLDSSTNMKSPAYAQFFKKVSKHSLYSSFVPATSSTVPRLDHNHRMCTLAKPLRSHCNTA
jgi:hypothetical protein